MKERKIFVSNRSGLSLIELAIVLVILAILASVAIPVLQNIDASARNSATKGALGAIRTAIAAYYVSEAANNRPATRPTVGQVRDMLDDVTGPKVMQTGELPNNPWALVDTVKRANADNVTDATGLPIVKGDSCNANGLNGWCYTPNNGQFWANTANNGGFGGATENSF